MTQCPKNDIVRVLMKDLRYANVVGNLMYAQICVRVDIAFAIGRLGWYLSNVWKDHWVLVKMVLRYLKRTKDHMMAYRKVDNLLLVGYIVVLMIKNPHQATSRH